MARRQSPSSNDNDQRYCVCQKREDEFNEDDKNDFMIECDGCNQWFHGRCIGLADRIADDIEKYFCNQCSTQHGSSIFKPRRNQHRRDYSDPNAENKPTQSGTPDFIQKLKRKVLPSCESVITKLTGHQLTVDHLLKNGFTRPILVPNREGLELTLPNRSITLQEINELVGPDRYIDIIDCEKQVTYKMSLDDYIDYFESFERNKIYNVLSLEVSNTKLGEQVITPRIVRDISWATIGVWPEKNNGAADMKGTWLASNSSKKKRRTISSSDTDQTDDEDFQEYNANHFENFERPEVAKYCLMSPQSSFTDFHVDFGGSSVWYSVVRGEKIFYLIEPTDENLQKYADWTRSPTESETFLGDCVSHCYKMHLREDNTVFIPAGWIHAVYTVTDSLVFGGNFLQAMGVDMQLRIYELERSAQVPHKFQFPLFETFHWYAAKSFYDELKANNESNTLKIDPVIQQACESMLQYMSKWLINDKRYQIRQRQIIPKGISCEKLLRDLGRELDIFKNRYGSSSSLKPPSNSIIASPIKVVVPVENKQELVQFNDTKIKVKCRRLSSESQNTKNSTMITTTGGKIKKDLSNSGMKLTIKTSLSGCRKPNSNRDLTPIAQKKKQTKTSTTIKPAKNINTTETKPPVEPVAKMTYTLDLEAKRQRFIEPSTSQPINTNSQSDTDDNHSSTDTNPSSIGAIDLNDSQDDNQETIEGLSAFVKSSPMNHDLYPTNKETKTKREHSSSGDSKLFTPKKSKSTTTIDGSKLPKIPKKIKTEDVQRKKLPSTGSVNASPSTVNKNPGLSHLNGTVANKKRLSSNSPKKVNSKDRLGKILKIANTIKSRGGILT